ncbi:MULTISPECIES: heme exporter protein CcmB [Candidatus Microthrix]|nr:MULTISPECIES: heme exporter protein CcmB [Microthrix]MBP7852402.1 heme exporter protein CcmB [Candidatus Microthrix sp.]MBP8956865.1 heme exporter protein CcmB [Candidatus Microthrix sp.]MBP9619738.1 heme exporter protein CcmB [Candidatus Microthrix sp.]
MRRMIGDALLMAAKDLRLEFKARVGLTQVLPFGVLVLVVMAFALDAESRLLVEVSPGLFWVTVTFAAVLMVTRSSGLETEAGVGDALRLSGMAPSAVFLGKAAAVAAQLLVLEVTLAATMAVLYRTPLSGPALGLATMVAATAGMAAVGTLLAALASSTGGRESLIPLLMLPVLAPVLIGATRATDVALGGSDGTGGWPWVALLGVFALSYVLLGALAYRSLMEES